MASNDPPWVQAQQQRQRPALQAKPWELAKQQRAAKPSTASRLLGGAEATAKDVGFGLFSPKEWGRELVHAASDSASQTLYESASTLSSVGKLLTSNEHPQTLSDINKYLVGTGLEKVGSATEYVAHTLKSQKEVREPLTTTGKMVEFATQWALSNLVFKKIGLANKFLRWGAIGALAMDTRQQGLSDLVQQYPALRNPITKFFSVHPNDSEAMAAVRSGLATVLGSEAGELMFRGLSVFKNAFFAKRNMEAFKLPSTPLVRHEDLGMGAHILRTPNGEMHLQESDNSIIVKHIEVAEGARKKGEGSALYSRAKELAQAKGLRLESDTGVSQDAARRWRALGARENPHTISPATGHLISSNPRKGVFELGPTDEELEERGRQEASAEIAGRVDTGHPADVEGQLSRGAEKAEKEAAPVANSAKPRARLADAFTPTPVLSQLKGFLSQTGNWLVHILAPESLSKAAAQGGAAIMNAVTRNAQHINEIYAKSSTRKAFWDANPHLTAKFIRSVERGTPSGDEMLERAKEFYRRWAEELAEGDKERGISYKEQAGYIPRMFENEAEVEEFIRKLGMKEASFAKDRSFDLLEQAIAAGYKLRFKNLEEMFQVRQHASDIARARVDTMKILAKEGLATEVKKAPEGVEVQELGVPQAKAEPRPTGVAYSTPDGKTYIVSDENVRSVLKRMFDERSLWTRKDLIGSAYRGLMTLKNNLIPVKLAFSLFHPIHVLSMHTAAALARSVKLGRWEFSHYSEGSRMLSILQGKVPANEITEQERMDLNYFAEGGLGITQDPRYQTQAVEKLSSALQRNSVLAVPHLFTAAFQTVQNALFKTWIPSLKAANYLADVRALLRSRPELMDDAGARRLALRKLAKSVDNRFGEMNYNSLFWPRYLRDVSVLSTLSMGWQLGLLREYGGGAGQLGRLIARPQDAKAMLKKGDLDKLLYVANYTFIAGALGGLMTWAMTGQHPKGTEDLLAPRTGETNPDGTPARSRTMFYPYEFLAQTKRFEHEGLLGGVKDLLESKGSGVFEMISEAATGVNSLGQEIRDPNSSAFQQVKQTLEGVAKDWAPISLEDRGQQSTKQKVLDVLGFTPAPRYLQQTSGEAAIEQTYDRYYRAGVEPFVTAAKSDLRKQLKAAYAAKDDDKTNKILTQMMTQYGLRAQDVRRMFKDVASGKTAYQQMFEHFTLEQQEAVLRKMKPEERKQYEKFISPRERARLAQAGY